MKKKRRERKRRFVYLLGYLHYYLFVIKFSQIITKKIKSKK
jgi:hypothetical protein